MEQENNEINSQEFQETDLRDEKAKKLLIILIVLLFFGGTYYYYGFAKVGKSSLKASHTKHVLASAQKTLSTANEGKAMKQVQGDSAIKNDKKTESSKKEEIKPEEKTVGGKIKPTDKSTLLGLSGKAAGKHDPFSYSESKFIPFTADSGENSSSLPGALPPVPNAGSTGSLPSIPGLPGAGPLGLANPPAPKPEDLIIVKGFIGNKVIAEIDGVVEALSPSERINNVKVLSVNPSGLSARFEINGKPCTKTIKSLTSEYSGEMELIRNQY